MPRELQLATAAYEKRDVLKDRIIPEWIPEEVRRDAYTAAALGQRPVFVVARYAPAQGITFGIALMPQLGERVVATAIPFPYDPELAGALGKRGQATEWCTPDYPAGWAQLVKAVQTSGRLIRGPLKS
jgi:hypothetical protein